MSGKDDEPLMMWVVFDHPNDFPNSWVARMWLDNTPQDTMLMADSYELIEMQLRNWDYINIGRNDEDDSKIHSVWI